jgi:hypothetical protein
MTQEEKARSEKQQYWEDQIQKWQASGLNQRAYCRLYQIDRQRFTYWKKRLSTGRSTSSLVEVSLNRLPLEENLSLSPLRLLIGGGRYRIEVESGFDPATLHHLIYILEGQ